MIKNCWRNKNVTLAAYFSWRYLHIHLRYYMNMLCNCIAFFKILTVTKSFNSPENASTYFDYSSLLATHWIYPRAYIVQQQVNELFFREKKYMSSSRLRLPQVLWAKMEKNSAINTMYTSNCMIFFCRHLRLIVNGSIEKNTEQLS